MRITCECDLPDFFHIYSNIFAIYASGHDLKGSSFSIGP